MVEGRQTVVVGPGAMGLLHAAYLRRAGDEVTLLDYRPERAARLNAQGVLLATDEGEWEVSVPCTAAPDWGPVDLLIIFVKAYATAQAVAHAAPLIGPGTVLLTLQNGLGNLEALQAVQRPECVLAGTTSSAATLLGEGRIHVAAVGKIVLGAPVAAGSECAAEVAAVFSGAGLPAVITADVRAALWRKAIINAAINPLTALSGLRNGQLLQAPALRLLLRQVAAEGAGVARARGQDIPSAQMPDEVEEICRLTANNRSSMLQDLSAGRRTEIDQICGAIVGAARELGQAAPLNAVLAALVMAARGTQN